MQESVGSGERHAWRAVALLCCLFALSFLDRMVLALVVDPVRTSLDVTDTQISLLFGLGFVVVYVLAGFPAAQLVDEGRRRQILLGGVLLWSGATFLSAFADSYAMLVACRSGVAIGEAVLMPAAMSLISDMFPKERRTLPTTVYTLTGVMMGAGSFIVGAGALKLAEQLSPMIGAEPWRIMFVIVAIPGPILVALFAALVKEPGQKNRETGSGQKVPGASLADFFAHFRAHGTLYLPVFIGTGASFTVALGMSAWGPTLLTREHGVEHASAGLFFGLFAIVGALVGMLGVTPLVRLLGARSPVRGALLTAILLNLTVLPVLAFLVGGTDTRWVLAGIAIGTCGSIATAAFTPIILQAVTPTPLLGRMSALYLMFNNVLGMGLGPILVSTLAAQGTSDRNIGAALTTVAWGAIAVSLTCYLFALWRLGRTKLPVATQNSPAASFH